MPKSASRYVIPVSVIAIVLVLMVVFRLIPADVVVRLGFFKSFTQESPKTPTLTKQITISPSSYETTYHNVTVAVHGDKYMIKIDPLEPSTLLYNITNSYANYTCSCQSQMFSPNNSNGDLNSSNSEHAGLNVSILYQNKTYTLMRVEYNEGEAKDVVFLEESTIWSYSELLGGIERKCVFTYIGAPGDGKERLYKLVYSVQHSEYNLTLIATLTLLDEETYNTSTTQIIFTRGEKSNVTSLELVII